MALMNPLLGSNLVTASAPFDPTLIGNSVWLDGSADCLTKSLSSGAAQSRLIISTWVQRTAFSSTAEYAMVTSIGGVASSRANRLKFEDDGITVHLESTTAATTIIKTSAVYRDVGWYHVLLSIDGNVVDSTQLYVNGIRQTTSITTGSAFTGSLGSFGHGGATTMIGKYNNTASDSYFLPAYLAQTTMLVGQSIQNSDVAITDFLDTFTLGTNGSQFSPKADADIAALATTAGGNSFCLDFSSASVALSSGVTPTSNAGTVSGSLSNLTDGNFTSDWRSDVDPATSVDNDHVAFDLGSAKDVKAVKITGRSSITGNFKVQFSDNGSDFTDTGTTFSNVSITTTANSGILDLTSDNPGSHRYWKLINISNSSGTSAWGFYQIILASAVGNLGTDASGNGNDFTPTSMSSANQSSSTPSLNYAVLNILDKGSSATTSEGATRQPTATDHVILSSMQIPATGKWAISGRVDAGDFSFGICTPAHTRTSKIGRTNDSWGAIDAPGASFFRSEHDSVGSNSTVISAANDTFIIAFDSDSGKLWLGRNDGGAGIAYLGGGDPTTGATPTYTLSASEMSPGLHFAVGSRLTVSFGQRTHFETLPTDFLELNSENLPAPEYQGIDYFKPVLYTGNGTAIGSGGKSVTGVGWQPDEVWIKNRDATDDHALYDIVRGVTKQLESNTYTAESTETEGLTTFGSDGFTVGNSDQVNTNTEDYVSWNWLGSNSTATTSPAGTIASTTSVASAGHFSVGTYTGQTAAGTVGHGLGGVAEMVIVWDKSTDNSIVVYHAGVASDAETDYLVLNQTDAATDSALMWNDTAPTASVFSVGTGTNTNGSARPKSFLAFRSVAGVCKVGSYIGNGSADGPYISTGFKPSFIMIKRSAGGTGDWNILDTSREPFNAANPLVIRANLANADEAGTIGDFDILSDGFKLKAVSANANTASSTYIYLAMADIGGNGTLPPVYGR